MIFIVSCFKTDIIHGIDSRNKRTMDSICKVDFYFYITCLNNKMCFFCQAIKSKHGKRVISFLRFVLFLEITHPFSFYGEPLWSGSRRTFINRDFRFIESLFSLDQPIRTKVNNPSYRAVRFICFFFLITF